MTPTRPLRDVFGDLAGEGAAGHAGDILRASGHPDLPDSLVAEAIVNFADTAPVEVAEHLAPYVMAHSPVPFDAGGAPLDPDPGPWLDLLATAPTGVPDDDPAGPLDAAPAGDPATGVHHDAAFDLDFGGGDAGVTDHADDRAGWSDDPAARLATHPDQLPPHEPDPATGVDSGLFTVDSAAVDDPDGVAGADDGDLDDSAG